MKFSATPNAPETVRRGLDSFHEPSSVAVVGASNDAAKWGHWIARGALTGVDRRGVYLVNKSGKQIAGYDTFTSLQGLPEVPELVVVVVPGHLVHSTITEALEMGARSFLIITARVPDEAALVALMREHNARMIGPNSLGIFSGSSQLQLMWGEMMPGSLAVISQSGQLGSEIAALGRKAGVGISRFVSLGNQSDVHAADVIRSLASDEQTRTLAIYMEDFSRGEEIFAAIREVRERGTAVAVLTTGNSDASRDLAQSHTGAMTSAIELVDAACREVGAVRVSTPSELVRLAELVEKGVVCRGPRVAVVSDSGGQGGIAADEAARLGLELPALSAQLREQLAAVLPEGASTRNPIDLAGAGEADMTLYAKLTNVLATSGEVDAVVLSGYFGSYGFDTPALLEAELAVAAQMMSDATGDSAPVLIHAMEAQSVVSQQLRANGVPVTDRIEDVLSAIALSRTASQDPRPDVRDRDAKRITKGADNIQVREELAAAGIEFPEMRIVRTRDEAALAAIEFGATVVLKAAWLAHKTEHDGVRLGLDTGEAAAEAFEEMHERLGDGPYTLELQDTRLDVAEYIVSVRRDPGFGIVATVGTGGTATEIWGDIAIELGPVSVADARGMILGLTSAPLLGEWRGRDALDVDALARTVSVLSYTLAASPDVAEIELNPVRVGVKGSLAVDCLALPTLEPTETA